MPVFTSEERDQVRSALVAAARTSATISGAAHTGSAALGREDRWSDIDLALRLADDAAFDSVVAEWTNRMYREHDAVAHHDVWRGTTLYRVFLLANTLQVDLAFCLPSEFGATGPSFRLIFGDANARAPAAAASTGDLIGMAWLYALHVRSSIARGRLWQAEYMLSGMRDSVLALACLRHHLPAHQGRGMDDLPPDVLLQLTPALARSLDVPELGRAFRATTEALLREIARVDGEMCKRVADTMRALAG
jgi:hypothetical protein